MEQSPLLENYKQKKNIKSAWKLALAGVFTVGIAAVCSFGTENKQIRPENFMMKEEQIEMEPAELVQAEMVVPEPLELDGWEKADEYYQTVNKVVEVADAINEFAEFAELAPMLADLGPEMAVVGGLISLGMDLFGNPGPTQAEINGKKLDSVEKDLHQMSRQMLHQYKGLTSQALYDTCYNHMEQPKNAIVNAMINIHAVQEDKAVYKRVAALSYGQFCMEDTLKLFDNILGGRCSYFNTVAKGNDADGIWPNNLMFIKKEYSAWLLLLNQGMICTSAYQAAVMHDNKLWVKTPDEDIKQWVKRTGFTERLQKVGQLASENMKKALSFEKGGDQAIIQEKLDAWTNKYEDEAISLSHGDTPAFVGDFYAKLQEQRPQYTFALIMSNSVFHSACYGGTKAWKSLAGYNEGFETFLFIVPKKQTAAFTDMSGNYLANGQELTSSFGAPCQQKNWVNSLWPNSIGAIIDRFDDDQKWEYAYGVANANGKAGYCSHNSCVGVTEMRQYGDVSHFFYVEPLQT